MFSPIAVAVCLGTAVFARAQTDEGDSTSGCSDLSLPSAGVWHDAAGPAFGCGWYAVGSRCESDGLRSRNVHVANEACCVCGGGVGENDTDVPPTSAPPTPAPPTFTPHDPQCQDRLLPDGSAWHMPGRSSYTCSWFERSPRLCLVEGHYSNVYDANTACCVCGGGLDKNETNAPPTSAPPTPAPATFTPRDPQCQDRLLPDGSAWRVHLGARAITCQWLERSPRYCLLHGHRSNVYDANTACCVCGGGSIGPHPSS